DFADKYLEFLPYLAEQGFVACICDLRGHGKSDGITGYARRWSEYLDDVRFFRQQIQAQHPELPLFLIGQSHGGLLLTHHGIVEGEGLAGVILVAPFLQLCMPVPAYLRVAAVVLNVIAPWLGLPSRVRSEMLSADPNIQVKTPKMRIRRSVATPR